MEVKHKLPGCYPLLPLTCLPPSPILLPPIPPPNVYSSTTFLPSLVATLLPAVACWPNGILWQKSGSTWLHMLLDHYAENAYHHGDTSSSGRP